MKGPGPGERTGAGWDQIRKRDAPQSTPVNSAKERWRSDDYRVKNTGRVFRCGPGLGRIDNSYQHGATTIEGLFIKRP
jgi:hypothetical protein